MGCATARTVTLEGLRGHVVDVQADVGDGMVATTLVGRPDSSINEARDRCRSAVINSKYTWPNTKRVTVLLSPADLPKRGPHFDVSIAAAVLAAAGEVLEPEHLHGVVLVGELTLDGRLRAVPGVLPMILAARAHGLQRALVPDVQLDEAAMVEGIRVVGVRSLRQVVAHLSGREMPDADPVAPLGTSRVISWRGDSRTEDLDLADVHGMSDARYALEVAAAGGHHLMLSGPKGAGKTTLAERLPGILPDLGVEEALELSAVHSLTGDLQPRRGLDRQPPFRAPHHSATRASMLGGGTGQVHPGEVTRALHGVLFLDEFPLFNSDIIDALRQPLESGEVTIARGADAATFPARAMIVLACNPCPCGDYHPDARQDRCSCTESRRRQYRARMSAPVVDRIDIFRHVVPMRPHERRDPLSRPEPSEVVRERVVAARERQASRYAGTAWRLNADVPGPRLMRQWPLDDDGTDLLDDHVCRGAITHRGATRVHRVAWTVADLRGLDRPGVREVETALLLRTGQPLPLSALAGAAR